MEVLLYSGETNWVRASRRGSPHPAQPGLWVLRLRLTFCFASEQGQETRAPSSQPRAAGLGAFTLPLPEPNLGLLALPQSYTQTPDGGFVSCI